MRFNSLFPLAICFVMLWTDGMVFQCWSRSSSVI
uniref:Uncharacterized protein n=1 Tax=Arundo donax TaxID=35708 RepID=A0A0A9G797_ARUDO